MSLNLCIISASRCRLEDNPKYCTNKAPFFLVSFHSIMVGLGLGTSTEEGFVPYFVAITFHQFFDGCGK